MSIFSVAFSIFAGATGDQPQHVDIIGDTPDTGHGHSDSLSFHVPPGLAHTSEHGLINPFTPDGTIKPLGDHGGVFSSIFGDEARFGTEGENGGPNPDPDRADFFPPRPELPPEDPFMNDPTIPATILFDEGGVATGEGDGGIGPTGPNGGPTTDYKADDLAAGEKTPEEEHREWLRRRWLEDLDRAPL